MASEPYPSPLPLGVGRRAWLIVQEGAEEGVAGAAPHACQLGEGVVEAGKRER